MKFSVILDSVNSIIIPSETNEGMTWKQAIDYIIEYCQDTSNTLQEEYFEVVRDHKEDYLNNKFSVVLV